MMILYASDGGDEKKCAGDSHGGCGSFTCARVSRLPAHQTYRYISNTSGRLPPPAYIPLDHRRAVRWNPMDIITTTSVVVVLFRIKPAWPRNLSFFFFFFWRALRRGSSEWREQKPVPTRVRSAHFASLLCTPSLTTSRFHNNHSPFFLFFFFTRRQFCVFNISLYPFFFRVTYTYYIFHFYGGCNIIRARCCTVFDFIFLLFIRLLLIFKHDYLNSFLIPW